MISLYNESLFVTPFAVIDGLDMIITTSIYMYIALGHLHLAV